MLAVFLICVANCIVAGDAQDYYSVRLNNSFGNTSKEGRLEIYYSGSWGTVCDDGFTNNSARVACASLGFGYMGAVVGNRYGPGTDPIWLDDVKCTGSENGIHSCPHSTWGQHNCSHSKDVSISCDCTTRYFSASTGRISSPNFPLAYANNLDCFNYITVATGQKISITFLSFNTEQCCDSVTITCSSGGSYISPSYAGSQIPETFTISSCTQVNVYFHTNGLVTSTGFSLTYNITSDCADRYFSGASGQISSPNFPLAYTNNRDCNNFITVPSGQYITITFLAFYTESAFDWVTITCSSGNSYTSPRYTGTQIPGVMTISLCTIVNVYFHTDGSVTYTGFNLTYTITSACFNYDFAAPSGQISSPNYPMAYSNNLDCHSYITVRSAQNISFTFWAFTTQLGNDWLMITCSSGNSYTSPSYSGSQIPGVLTISSCTQVNVYFHTDSSVTYTGFNLTYNITSDCADRYFTGPAGQISSQNFPFPYDNNRDCSNYITLMTGQKIIIRFIAFNTQSSNDWVTVTCSSGNSYLSPRFSGTQIPADLTISTCTKVNVYFHTDSAITSTGFNLTYNITSDCAARSFYGPTGQISSPNFPMAYTNNRDCNNFITIPSGQYVTITFVAFNTEPENDWVTISCSSGSSYTSPRYSGSQIPGVLTISSCNQVNVYFHTDSSVTYTGFNLTYNITSGCADRYFSGPTGQISSPNFPLAYNNNQDCSNFITILSGQQIVITFLSFNTETGNDWVTISCSSGNAYTSPRYSGSQIPGVLTLSSCNQVNVYFHADNANSYAGFNLTYNITSDCADRYFYGPIGQISSPNFPLAYSSNRDCSNFITILTGQIIVIRFFSFNVETGNDWLQISCSSGNAYTSPRYSGSQIPGVLTLSSCNQVNVYFHSDNSVSYTGFNLTYNITSDCADRYFSEPTGQISSQNYPMAYDNNRDCSNYITVPTGQTIIIEFLAFSTELSNDWVMVTCESGNVFASPRYSDSEFPAVLTISACSLVNVYFHTNEYITDTGFSLTYNFTSDTVIGGISVKPSTALARPDTNDSVIFNCTTSTKYPPWWTISSYNFRVNYTITNSTCGIINSAQYSALFTTETLGPGSCNLIMTAASVNDLWFLFGSVVCTDSTLASARAILAPINLELSFTNYLNSTVIASDIVRNEEFEISCDPSFTSWSSSSRLVFTYTMYSGLVQLSILRTYWTSEESGVSSVYISNTSSYVLVKAPAGIIPPYTCNIVVDFFSTISDASNDSPFVISFSTDTIDVSYWPTEDTMTITGDNNGQIQIPAVLNCSAAANPPATYTWIDESNGNITNGSTIVINHGGNYTCTASNIIRGQYYQQSKSINLQVQKDDANGLRSNLLAIILGSVLGAVALIIIIILVIVLCRKCRQQKTKTTSDVGHINHGNELELRQTGIGNNNYELGFKNDADLDQEDYVNIGGLSRRPVSIFPDIYEEIDNKK